MTINGGGFSADSSVTVGSKSCEINTVNYDQIQCVAPSLVSSSLMAGLCNCKLNIPITLSVWSVSQ